MRKETIILLVLIQLLVMFLTGCSVQQKLNTSAEIEPGLEATAMKLSSTAFEHNGKIPSKYTCDGQNISPPLNIEDVPPDAKSLVLIMDDPDIPPFVKERYGIQVWDHWVVWNVPPTTKEIPENQDPAGVIGKNTGGRNAYGGPCPPDREHRYFFRLYALNATLNLPEGSTKVQVEKAMEGQVLARAELIGRYRRQ